MVDVRKAKEDGKYECVLDYSMNTTMIQKAVIAMLGLALVMGIVMIGVAGYFLLQMGMDRSEISECNTWRAQAVEFADNSPAAKFYILRWQKDQCDAHGITINAPVK